MGEIRIFEGELPHPVKESIIMAVELALDAVEAQGPYIEMRAAAQVLRQYFGNWIPEIE